MSLATEERFLRRFEIEYRDGTTEQVESEGFPWMYRGQWLCLADENGRVLYKPASEVRHWTEA